MSSFKLDYLDFQRLIGLVICAFPEYLEMPLAPASSPLPLHSVQLIRRGRLRLCPLAPDW